MNFAMLKFKIHMLKNLWTKFTFFPYSASKKPQKYQPENINRIKNKKTARVLFL